MNNGILAAQSLQKQTTHIRCSSRRLVQNSYSSADDARDEPTRCYARMERTQMQLCAVLDCVVILRVVENVGRRRIRHGWVFDSEFTKPHKS